MTITSIILLLTTLFFAGFCSRLLLRQRSQDTPFEYPAGLVLQVSNNDIMQYIKKSAAQIEPLMKKKNVSFKVKCEPESMMGWIDNEWMDKVFALIVSDIMKRIGQDGKAGIEAYTNERYDRMIIRFYDNGEQMKQQTLSFIHYMVNYHHGHITADYSKKQGNIIQIELPITKEAYPTNSKDRAESSAFNIPNNIELRVPTIELPNDYEAGNESIREIMHTAPHHADQLFLQRAVKCINEHLNDSDYDRQAFATDMGTSISTLYNKIRSITGKSLTTFARDIRIKAACRLAKENPDLRVSDIAYQVGFRDPKYFATSFKRVTGLQPKEYIQKVRSEVSEEMGAKLTFSQTEGEEG